MTPFLNPREYTARQEDPQNLGDESNEIPLGRAYEKLTVRFVEPMRAAKPKMDDFCDIYSEDKINQDKQRLLEYKRKESPHSLRSEILEAVIWHELEASSWLGENVFTKPASEFDDREHGVDFVIEFVLDNDEVVRLAVDVTMNSDTNVIDKKMNSVIDPILRKGEFPKLEYFYSEADEQIGKEKITQGTVYMPKIILGIDPSNFETVAKEITAVIDSPQKRECAEELIKNQIIEQVHAELVFQILIMNQRADRLKKINDISKIDTLFLKQHEELQKKLVMLLEEIKKNINKNKDPVDLSNDSDRVSSKIGAIIKEKSS